MGQQVVGGALQWRWGEAVCLRLTWTWHPNSAPVQGPCSPACVPEMEESMLQLVSSLAAPSLASSWAAPASPGSHEKSHCGPALASDSKSAFS